MKLIGSICRRIIRISPKRATGAVPILKFEGFASHYGACHIVVFGVTINDISAAIFRLYRLAIDDDYLAAWNNHRYCQKIVA
jgi:hypothetical protein